MGGTPPLLGRVPGGDDEDAADDEKDDAHENGQTRIDGENLIENVRGKCDESNHNDGTHCWRSGRTTEIGDLVFPERFIARPGGSPRAVARVPVKVGQVVFGCGVLFVAFGHGSLPILIMFMIFFARHINIIPRSELVDFPRSAFYRYG